MKKNILTIERHLGNILINGYAVVTFSNEDLEKVGELLQDTLKDIDKYVKK